MTKVEGEALQQMQTKVRPRTRWAAYQNKAFDSSAFGAMKFLLVGEDCTFEIAPKRLPDTQEETNWPYCFYGWVDITSGEIDVFQGGK